MFKQISYVYTMISFAWSLWILLLLNHNTYIWYVQYFTSVIQRAFWKYYTLNCFPGIFQQFPTIYEGMLFAPFPHLLVWFITAALISAFCSTPLWYVFYTILVHDICHFSPQTYFLNCVNCYKTRFAAIHLKVLDIQNFSTSQTSQHLKLIHIWNFSIRLCHSVSDKYQVRLFSFLHYLVCVPREVNIGVPCVVSWNILKSYAWINLATS